MRSNIKKKTIVFPYVNNQVQKWNYFSSSIYNRIKTIEYLGINLTKDAQGLCKETVTLLRETEENLDNKISHKHVPEDLIL